MNRLVTSTDATDPAGDSPLLRQVHFEKRRPVAEVLGENCAGARVHVAEKDSRALSVESPDDGGSDAVGSACDQNVTALEFRENHGRTMPKRAARRKRICVTGSQMAGRAM